jgi:hypothetical protein
VIIHIITYRKDHPLIIELTALIVEGVGQFVPDGSAELTVVGWRWLPRNCRRLIDYPRTPIRLPDSALRSPRTVAQTTSTPGISRAGSSKTWSDAGSPGRNPGASWAGARARHW